jgi:protein-tyrosine phosphatase
LSVDKDFRDIMGVGFSVDTYLSNDQDDPKAVMLLVYEKESLIPISFTDFVQNPLAFSLTPLVLLEPFKGSPAPIVTPTVQGVSYQDTVRVFHQHFRIQNFRLSTQFVWVFSPVKVPKVTISGLMTYLRKAPLQNFASRKSVEAPAIFSDLNGLSNLKTALRPPAQGNQVRASSPIRAAGQICGTTSTLMSRRSHNPGFSGTFVLPTIPKMEIKDETAPDDMNLVIPGIFVGGERAASNKQLLLDNHITHVINLSGITTNNYYTDTFQYFTVFMYDNDFEELPLAFWDAVTFLKKAMDVGGTTLVHCRRGICRSAALVAAFLNSEKALPLDSAIALIKSKRPIVNINPGFLDQLYSHEKATLKRKSKPRLLDTRPIIQV